MNSDNYLVFREDSFIHKYGNKFQVWTGLYSFYELNQLQGDITQMCDGTNTIEKIWVYILNKYSLENNEENKTLFLNVVSKLIENDIVKESVIKMHREIALNGKKDVYYPVWLICELTNTCNCNCSHCYKNAKSDGIHLDMSVFNKLCDEFSGYTPNLILTGGEPLIHPNIGEIIEKATEHFEVSMITNGILVNSIDTGLLKRLKRIQISLYGYDDLSYYKFTGCRDGFSHLQESMKKIKECHEVGMIMTLIITKNNMYELEKYIKAAIQIGAPAIKFALSTPMGRARGKNDIFTFDKEGNMEIHNIVKELREKYQKEIRIMPFENLIEAVPINKNEFGCQAGKSIIVVDETGNVRPCNMLPASAFRKYPLEEYIHDIQKIHSRTYEEDIKQLRIDMKKTGDKLEDMKCIGFCNFK